MHRLASLLLSLCLALPAVVADAASAQRSQAFGDVTIHYNAFASSLLQPEVAMANGVLRSRHQGVLVIAVLKAGKTSMATISGTLGRPGATARPLSFRQVSDHGAVSYVAQFDIEQPQVLRFDLDIQASGSRYPLSFNQEVFPGE
ncbi:DUF4426 domain-containing protein [Pseudomonas fulva]|nr:DUF4426 domain-containing protein [Pseudomonas fulva]MBF8778776.1 DUF4426 domain-containing protein [Pseudomonas fulva]